MTTPQKEQTGASALKAIEYMTPIIKEILDAQGTENAKEKFVADMFSRFDGMTKKEIFLLGHRLDALQQVTEILLQSVAAKALARIAEDQPVDPRLS